jgi:hypothetical protein
MSIVRDRLTRYASGLRFPYLVAIAGSLFLINVVVPDLVPYVDEILLALVTIMLSRIKRPGASLPIAQK